MLLLFSSLFLSNSSTLCNFRYFFFAIPVCFFNSLPNGDYLNLLIVAGLSNKAFSSKAYLSVTNSYLPTFADDKAEVLSVCLSKSYCALFC